MNNNAFEFGDLASNFLYPCEFSLVNIKNFVNAKIMLITLSKTLRGVP